MSRRKQATTELVTIDLAQVCAVVERIKPDVSEADYHLLKSTADALQMVTRELRKRGTTIARLRSMLGQRSSEKTAEVVGSAASEQAAPPTPQGDSAPGESNDSSAGETTGHQSTSGQAPRPKRKGHGRIPASAYDCEAAAVPHPTLCPGQECPGCAHGTLYDSHDPAPVVIIVGQPLLAAERFEAQCLRCNSCGVQFTAPLPERARGPKYTELGKVFHNEHVCKLQGLAGGTRLEYHQRESGPVMEGLKKWIDEQVESKTVEPNSDLGGALSYMTKRWDKLTLFLRMPDAPLENNITERGLKAAIRLRRASLFYATTRGALVGDVFQAIIYTTLLHGGNPLRYLTALFVHYKDVEAAPQDWLPWTYEAALSRLDECQTRAA